MKQEEFLKLVDKYNAGKCTNTEEALLLRYCEEVQREDITKSWNSKQEEVLHHQILSKINHRIEQANIKPSIAIRKRLRTVYQIAAAVLLLGVLSWVLMFYFGKGVGSSEHCITHTTSKGERTTVRLGDGSIVQLNSESSITYPEKFSEGERMITLQGEAYFQVKHDVNHPFIVNTQNISTVVLGTQFNVRAFQHDSLIQISLVKGAVEVSFNQKNNTKPVALKPKQELVINKNDGQTVVREFDNYAIIGWKDNVFKFKKTTLAEAVNQLEAHFAVDIKFANEDLKQYNIRGIFKGETATEVLNAMFGIAPEDCMKVEKQDNRLLIVKGDCK